MYVVRVTKNPNFGPKTSCFGPKSIFLVVQQFSKVVRPFGLIECFQTRYHMTIVQCIWSGLPNIGRKGAKRGYKGTKKRRKGGLNFFVFIMGGHIYVPFLTWKVIRVDKRRQFPSTLKISCNTINELWTTNPFSTWTTTGTWTRIINLSMIRSKAWI